MIELAHTAYDGTRTYRNRRGADVAYAAGVKGIVDLGQEFSGWKAFGSPTQDNGLFLLVAPGYQPENTGLDPGEEGWLAMTLDGIAEFSA